MHIREAHRDDADTIANLHAESWRHAYRGMFRDEFLDGDVHSERQAVWRQRLTQPPPNQLVLLAESDNEALGFICAYGAHDPQWGTFIDNLHIRLQFKRRGIGRALISAVAQWAEQHYPGNALHLEVLAPNLPARGFYESLGARQQAAWLWQPPGGGEVENLRYVWSRATELSSE